MKKVFFIFCTSILIVICFVHMAQAETVSFGTTFGGTKTGIAISTNETMGNIAFSIDNTQKTKIDEPFTVYKTISDICTTDIVLTDKIVMENLDTLKKDFVLPSLSPNTTYCFTYADLIDKHFTTDKGTELPGGTSPAVSDGSYHLLAPFPGLSVLIDQSQCGSAKPGEICSIGDLLNFIFKILIGVTAVILVFRLVYEGYTYMVTDVPFLKASSKGNFMTALGGLLLAMAAWLILNTINPKLVSNDISVEEVSVGVEQQLALEQAGYDAAAIKNLSPDDIRNIVISYQGKYKYIQNEYIPARDAALPSASKGVKILITAHTAMEGFYPGAKSYRTNNPGNIGNTDNGATVTYATLGEGIKKQYDHINGIVNGTNPNYKIGTTYPSIGTTYDGSLYQYIKIYATGARQSNTYLSYIISYFKKEGYIIDGHTKMSEIAALR